MDPLLIVSPHLDDAVLSCGQLMAGRSGCVVATVFAGTPDPGAVLTSYDRDCGFASATDALSHRRLEDADAVGILGASTVHLGYLDHQYRELGLGPYVDPAIVAAALARVCDERGVQMAVGPLGLAHPDHRLAAEAFRQFLGLRRQVEAWVYEDVPSRVLWPEEVPDRLGWWHDVGGFSPALGFCGTGPIEAKETAIAYYGTQLDALRTVCGGTLHPVLVPERYHRLWRSDP